MLRQLPLKTFWMLHKNIDRIAAERDMRASEVMIHSQSGDGYKAITKRLQKQMGEPFVIDEAKHAATEATARTSRSDLMRLSRLGDLTNNVYPG